MSLDGYIAAADGGADWIVHDPDIDFGAIFSRFDTVLIGRKTYETMLTMGPGGGFGKGITSYVVSTTLRQADHPKVRVVSEPETLVRELKRTPGKDIWLFGGGELFRTLLGAGLVDAVDTAIVPVLLGGGVPLLPTPAPRARLKLARHRVYEKSGIVSAEYDVVAGRARARA
jgi:dihydrofolate reductase